MALRVPRPGACPRHSGHVAAPVALPSSLPRGSAPPHLPLHLSYILQSRVVIGANDLTQLGQEVEVRSIRRAILHEYFNNKTMINDIALLELDRPVHCSYYIQLACVPDPSLRVSELTDCYVSGWGHMGMRCEYPKRTAVPG